MLYMMQGVLYRKDKLIAVCLLSEINGFINTLPPWEDKPKNWLMAHPSKTIIAITPREVNSESIKYLDSAIAKKASISIYLAGDERDESSIIIWYLKYTYHCRK